MREEEESRGSLKPRVRACMGVSEGLNLDQVLDGRMEGGGGRSQERISQRRTLDRNNENDKYA